MSKTPQTEEMIAVENEQIDRVIDMGALLRRRREALQISDKEVVGALQIPLRCIHGFENNNFSNLPARIYSRGFFKKYVTYLGFESIALLAQFDVIWPEHAKHIQPKRQPIFFRGVTTFSFFDRKKILLTAFLAFFTIAGVYFLYQFRFAIFMPKLEITEPAQDMIVSGDVVAIKGSIGSAADLQVNGRSIYTNEQGEFSDSVLVAPGLNPIEFTARNRFGKTHTITRYILVK